MKPSDYGLFDRTGKKEVFTWAKSDRPRFGFTGMTLLNDNQFRGLDKPTLRIMRNEILARHGYRFSSPDLQEYFGSKSWYSPRQSNDEVYRELSIVEQLNIELIKAEETVSASN